MSRATEATGEARSHLLQHPGERPACRWACVRVSVCLHMHTHNFAHMGVVLMCVWSCLGKLKGITSCTSSVMFFEITSGFLVLCSLEDDSLQPAEEGCFCAVHVPISWSQWLEMRKISSCPLKVAEKLWHRLKNTVTWSSGLQIVPSSTGSM